MNARTQLSSAQLSLRHKPPDDTGPCQMQSITAQTPTRLQLFAQQRIVPLDVCTDGGAQTEVQHTLPSPIVSSPVTGTGPSGWGSITEHILEYILSALRDEQGRWPSRKVLFSVCGVCRLWRRVGHALFFSNVWTNHSDVVVHPSQLFTLSTSPLRLSTNDNLLRCFVRRTPCPSSGLTPRLGRLWCFSMYLGADHRARPGGGHGPGGAGAGPQLLMSAVQTSRRSYQIMLSPAPGQGPGGGGGWSGRGGGGGAVTPGSCRGHGAHVGAGGVVAVLRSNMRCSYYELLPESSSAWARRLVQVAGYLAPPPGQPPLPLIRLEYRLRVRGIMLPRRMKVQVPVPHSLQRVVHNPLYDMHEPSADGPMTPGSGGGAVAGGFGAAWLPPVGQGGFAHGQGQGLMGIGGAAAGAAAGGAGGQAPGAALLAPPVLAPVGAGGPAAGGEGGGVDGGGGIGAAGAGNEAGLMDHLEDMLDAALRAEPLLFANMVDAAAVRPADDDDAPAGGGGGGPAGHAAGGGAGHNGRGRGWGLGLGGLRRANSFPNGRHAAAAAGAGRHGGGRGWGLGGVLQRGFLLRRRPTYADGGGAGGGGANGGAQWWLAGGEEGEGRFSSGRISSSGAGGVAPPGGWAVAAAAPPVPSVRLQNKAPHWNDALMCWCLNFRGRVKMASVKNFQLACSADAAGRSVMQFGKVEEGVYILDFNPCVLTAAQAFAAALSTFETKYLL